MAKGTVILTTYPSEGEAVKAAKRLIEGNVLACANIMKVRSVYLWEGKLEEADEALVVMKTSKERFTRVRKIIEEEHPYEVPEVLEINAGRISKKYRTWLLQCVR